MPTHSIELAGLTCEACRKLTTIILKRLPEVTDVEVASDGSARIKANRELAVEEVQQAFQGTPYSVVKVTVH